MPLKRPRPRAFPRLLAGAHREPGVACRYHELGRLEEDLVVPTSSSNVQQWPVVNVYLAADVKNAPLPPK